MKLTHNEMASYLWDRLPLRIIRELLECAEYGLLEGMIVRLAEKLRVFDEGRKAKR